ncbi:MAG: hypothetical protein ACU0A4_16315 [Paracoccaceae bacterium]
MTGAVARGGSSPGQALRRHAGTQIRVTRRTLSTGSSRGRESGMLWRIRTRKAGMRAVINSGD